MRQRQRVRLLLWQLARNAEGDDPTNLESALIGKPVPKFRLESLDNPGQFYQADVLTQGKPVLLNVWATWCPTCRAEHQYLNQLSAQGIRVVGMNYKDDRQKAISWLKELGNPYALSLFDGDGMLGLDLGVYGAPETFLIDGNGIIRYRHAGTLRIFQYIRLRNLKLQPVGRETGALQHAGGQCDDRHLRASSPLFLHVARAVRKSAPTSSPRPVDKPA